MLTQIDRDARIVLAVLADAPRNTYLKAADLARSAGLEANRVNDAVALLVDSGYAEWLRTHGTGPFDFADVTITARGRYEHERLQALPKKAASSEVGRTVSPESFSREINAAQVGPDRPEVDIVPARPPSPVGSPYGFTDEDWEVVAERKGRADRLYVVLGHQFQSAFYEAEELRRNIRLMLEETVSQYNEQRLGSPVTLDYHALAAGYGEHLFNEIARDIISADVAVFETSDLNPNVMLEMGVALTWGVRVLPIKVEDTPKPPSDVSGQTWADYTPYGAHFSDPGHSAKMVRLVERAIRKKGKGTV